MNVEHQISKEMRAAQALKESLLSVTDDTDALRDTIEGETDLHETIALVMAAIRETEILETGLDAMTKALDERAVRLSARRSRYRAAIEQAMTIGEIKTLELADATITLKRVPPKLEIVDEAQIPAEFFEAVDPKLSRKAVQDALKDGRTVPGAILGNGSVTLSIRRA